MKPPVNRGDTYWLLTITKQMKAIDYDDRLRVARDLEHRINSVGVRHASLKNAVTAAEHISTNPLSVAVEVTKHVAKVEGIWRAGKKSKE